VLFQDLEDLVKKACADDEVDANNTPQETSTGDELVSKLAASLETSNNEPNSRLAVAKMLMAYDILSA
jgi:hypothetical protein